MRFLGGGASLPTILSLVATVGLILVNIGVPITRIDTALLQINKNGYVILSGLWGACNITRDICSKPKIGYQINHLTNTILGYLAVTHILAAVLSFTLTCMGGWAHKREARKPLLRSAARLSSVAIFVILIALVVDYLVYRELLRSRKDYQVEFGKGCVPITHIDIALLRIYNNVKYVSVVTLSGLWGACDSSYASCSKPKIGFQIKHSDRTILGYLAVVHILAAVLSFTLTCMGGWAHRRKAPSLLRAAARLSIVAILVDLVALLVDYLVYRELTNSVDDSYQVEFGTGWWILIGIQPPNQNHHNQEIPNNHLFNNNNNNKPFYPENNYPHYGQRPSSNMSENTNHLHPLPTPPNGSLPRNSSYPAHSNNAPYTTPRPLLTPPRLSLSNQHPSPPPLQSPNNEGNSIWGSVQHYPQDQRGGSGGNGRI
ncbi:11181_t:CDS:2 [Ambispora gerdemannii]|uniref:11181_t:CDS:1 n=1 Tax=Ambispora gerdemannii TaxID=144530 RepID=A0A9N8WDT6_9GLOM|nr:11181_t:CDS:2 [Ambispora gerdemannii]